MKKALDIIDNFDNWYWKLVEDSLLFHTICFPVYLLAFFALHIILLPLMILEIITNLITEDPPKKTLIPLGVALLTLWLTPAGMFNFQSQGNGTLGAASEIQIIEGSYLLPQAPPFLIHGRTFTSLSGIDDTLYRIIECESGWRWWVKNKRSSAFGLCQMIKSTREMVEKNIGKIDWQNPEEQLRACRWLYETQGVKHWQESRKCWAQ